VLALRRAVGFLPGATLSRFLVVQSDRLGPVLETVVVIPLDEAHPDYAGLPGLVAVARVEAGGDGDAVAVVPQVTSLPLSRFEAHPVARVKPATLDRVGHALRMVLDLG
jgi:mRNA-degrading endonuclease toxin of MazEF toxin-antitoxin module